jgi:hypothetical protein
MAARGLPAVKITIVERSERALEAGVACPRRFEAKVVEVGS